MLYKIMVVCCIKDLRLKFKFIINCTLHLFKDQPEDGSTIGPKRVDGITIYLIKYKVVYDCIIYI